MVKGYKYTKREIEYVRANMDTMCHFDIAKELSRRFPEDNGGFRSRGSINDLIRIIKYGHYRKIQKPKEGA